MILAVTGHRTERLGNIDETRKNIEQVLLTLNPDSFIQGMANGADLNSGVIAIKNNIPVVSVKPWAGHSPRKVDEYMYKWVWHISSIL